MQNRYFKNSSANPTAQQTLSSALPSTHPTTAARTITSTASTPPLKAGTIVKPVSSHMTSTSRSSARSDTRPGSQISSRTNELTRVFNTALVSSQATAKHDFSAELCALTESAPFKAILNAVRQLACVQGISERHAAEEVIRTFRKMDEVWNDYIFREGLDRLRNPRRSK